MNHRTIVIEALINRDGYGCAICKKPILPEEKIQLDHIVAVSNGGSDEFSNLQLAHVICNYRKSNNEDRRAPNGQAEINLYEEIDKFIAHHVHNALALSDGSQTAAAQRLGLSYRQLRYLIYKR